MLTEAEIARTWVDPVEVLKLERKRERARVKARKAEGQRQWFQFDV